MRSLSTLDTLFVSMDTPRWPLHGGGVLVLDPKTSPHPVTFEMVKQHLENQLPAMPPLRRRLIRTPFGLTEPVWAEDPDFNIDRHVHRIAIPKPGSAAELRELVAQLGDPPLDETRPLWDVWFIERLKHGRIALFIKMHHAYVDGMGGLDMLSHLMTTSPHMAHEVPPDDWKADRIPTGPEMLLRAVPNMVTRPLRAARAGTGLARAVGPGPLVSLLRRGKKQNEPAKTTGAPFKCPHVFFSEISPGQIRRAMGWVAAPMDDIATVRDAFGVKFNDVALAMVTGSLRNYLLERGGLPDEPLTAVNPVNMRHETDEHAVENRFSLLTPLLPTHIADPVERLEDISIAMGKAKSGLQHSGTNPVENLFDLVTPGTLELVMHALTRNLVPELPPVFNLCVTNIATSKEPRFICGARIEEFYIMMMQALGVGPVCAVITYAGKAFFSFTTNRELVPDPQRLADGLLEELGVLCKAAAERGSH
ncbi:MAG: wax ester/triacylglycerol synthase family O-acyltransferase [Mycobacterium sp.]